MLAERGIPDTVEECGLFVDLWKVKHAQHLTSGAWHIGYSGAVRTHCGRLEG